MSGKVVVWGATGFVGNELGISLVRAGYEVIVVSRKPERYEGLLGFPCRLVKDQDASHQLALFEGADAFFNLAGHPVADRRWTQAEKEKIRASRVDTTRLACSLVNQLEQPPKVFIQASAIGIYGDRGDETLAEDAAAATGFLADVCRDWERETASLPASVRCVIARIGVVLGHAGGALPQMVDIYLKGFGAALGSGQQWLSWIHIEDLVAALMHCMRDNSLQGVVNAVGPDPVRFLDFHWALSSAIGYPNRLKVPRAAVKLALGERARIVLDSQRVIPQRLLESGFKFQHASITDACEDLLGTGAEPRAAHLEVKQWLPLSRTSVWAFFSDAYNLEKITPPWLKFKVRAVSTQAISSGTLIDYTLSLRGLPFRWRTEILDWTPESSFVDTQLRGPYKLWHHTHRFEELGGGILMTDRVQFRLPFGRVGQLIAGAWVRGDVETIFNYRRHTIAQLIRDKDLG